MGAAFSSPPNYDTRRVIASNELDALFSQHDHDMDGKLDADDVAGALGATLQITPASSAYPALLQQAAVEHFGKVTVAEFKAIFYSYQRMLPTIHEPAAASLRVLFPADGSIGMEVTEVGQRHDRVGVDRPQAVPRRAGISRGLVITELNGLPLDRRLTVDAFVRRLRAAKQRGWPIVLGFAKLSAAEEERGSDTFDVMYSGHGGADAKPASSSFMGFGGTDDAVDEYDRGGKYTSGRRAGSPLRSSDSSRSIDRRRHGDEDAASSSFMGCGGTDDAVDEYDGGGKYTSGRRAGSSVRSSDSSRSIGRRRRREPYTVDRSHEYDDTYALCGCNTVDGGI